MLASDPAVLIAQDCVISHVVVGVDGHYRLGHWTVVRLEVESTTAVENVSIEVTVPDGEGVRSTIVTKGAQLAAGNNRVEAIAKFGRSNSDLQVAIRGPDGGLLSSLDISSDELPNGVLGSQHLVLTLGADVGVGEAITRRREKDEQKSVHALIAEPASLPNHWFGYAGVSLVALPCDSELAASLTNQQAAALEMWVRLGGRILLSAGESADRILKSDAPLASLVPGEYDRVQMQRQTNGVEDYAGKTLKTLNSYVADGELVFRLPMAVIQNPIGTVEAAEGIGGERTPLVIRASHGFGQVVFLSIDLNSAPINLWTDGRMRIMTKLVSMSLDETIRADSDLEFTQLTQIGFDDLTGQLRGSLDQFNSVRLVPFSWIAMLVGIYILLIGPVDYLLLRKWKQRFGLTWITFPLIVLLGCLLAYSLTNYWKGQTLKVNQLDVVDIDAKTGFVRGQSWSHIFSPTSKSFDLAVDTKQLGLELGGHSGELLSWQGLPGKSFGGMDTSRMSQSPVGYQMQCQLNSKQTVELKGLPIDTYSSRSLSGLIWGTADVPKVGSLTSDLEGQLSGTVYNPLSTTLRDCMLCYGRWVYPLPSLAAGGQADVDRFSKIKTIDGMLTRTQVDKDFKDKSQPWDRKSLDRKRIMEMMMFYKAAGGEEYTSLLNRFQRDIDFTDHLTQNTAMLIGKVDKPVTSLSDQNIETESLTYFRILMPVTKKRD